MAKFFIEKKMRRCTSLVFAQRTIFIASLTMRIVYIASVLLTELQKHQNQWINHCTNSDCKQLYLFVLAFFGRYNFVSVDFLATHGFSSFFSVYFGSFYLTYMKTHMFFAVFFFELTLKERFAYGSVRLKS